MAVPKVDPYAAKKQAVYEQQCAERAQQGRWAGPVGGECAPQEKESSFREATNRLQQEMEALAQTIDKLTAVLAPVLVPTAESTCGQQSAPCPPQSPIVQGLQNTANQIYANRQKLQILIGNIDL